MIAGKRNCRLQEAQATQNHKKQTIKMGKKKFFFSKTWNWGNTFEYSSLKLDPWTIRIWLIERERERVLPDWALELSAHLLKMREIRHCSLHKFFYGFSSFDSKEEEESKGDLKKRKNQKGFWMSTNIEMEWEMGGSSL